MISDRDLALVAKYEENKSKENNGVLFIEERENREIYYSWDCPGCGRKHGSYHPNLSTDEAYCVTCRMRIESTLKEQFVEEVKAGHFLEGATVVDMRFDTTNWKNDKKSGFSLPLVGIMLLCKDGSTASINPSSGYCEDCDCTLSCTIL